jgi:hypothetical protein
MACAGAIDIALDAADHRDLGVGEVVLRGGKGALEHLDHAKAVGRRRQLGAADEHSPGADVDHRAAKDTRGGCSHAVEIEMLDGGRFPERHRHQHRGGQRGTHSSSP